MGTDLFPQNEEKKKLAQLRKEQEEERQLAELQRLQEQSTGKKRVDKLDWMYAAPSNEGGALGGARIGEKEMEDYLLGKRRVDEVLKAGEQNVGGASSQMNSSVDVTQRLGMPIRSSSQFRMPIPHATPPRRSGKTRYWRSSSRSRRRWRRWRIGRRSGRS